MDTERSRLLAILKRTSYRKSDTPSFHLASGKDSKYYIDCKQALSDPEARDCLATIIFEMIGNENFDAIGGLELGAYPIATSVSDKIYEETGHKVCVFVVRKELKTHGIKKFVAGDTRDNDHVLIVDDVITSGDSAIQAIERVRAAGLTVDRVIAMVDREESDGRRNIENKNVRFDALFTLDDLKNCDVHTDQRADRDSNQERTVSKQSARRTAIG
ncbi:MAG: orotate phosphoribosyltransferase [Candidatus Binataceae bacterium]